MAARNSDWQVEKRMKSILKWLTDDGGDDSAHPPAPVNPVPRAKPSTPAAKPAQDRVETKAYVSSQDGVPDESVLSRFSRSQLARALGRAGKGIPKRKRHASPPAGQPVVTSLPGERPLPGASVATAASILLALLMIESGCAKQGVWLTKRETATNGVVTETTSRVTTWTFFDSKASVDKVKTSNAPKSQSVGAEGVSTESSGSNAVIFASEVVGAAVRAAVKP